MADSPQMLPDLRIRSLNASKEGQCHVFGVNLAEFAKLPNIVSGVTIDLSTGMPVTKL